MNPESHLPFSMQLPDCRAFELVSPPYKEGYPIAGTIESGVDVVGISADGSRVLAMSLGVFGGSVSDPLTGVPYDLTRTGSGWTTSALAPSPGQFPYQKLFAGSEDLARSVWALREPTQTINEEDLYLREQDGSFVKVGPLVAPSLASGATAGYYNTQSQAAVGFAGASDDLSHVLFNINQEGWRWPFDTTQGGQGFSSLYEYDGINNSEPALVGVMGGAGDHTLISDCGTRLGSAGQEDTYNAVSGSGGTVYFTAEGSPGHCVTPEVNEVYARVDGEKTVAISSPSYPLVQGSGPEPDECDLACEKAAHQSGEFQGASHDGSKVFFLTTQPLLNEDTDTGTDLYEAEIEGVGAGAGIGRLVQVSHDPNPGQAAEVQGVARVSEDGSHVYFVARGVLAGADGEGRSPVLGAENLYVFERDVAYPQGRVAFITDLCSGFAESGTTADSECFASDGNDWQTSDARPVQATPDGRFLVFASNGDLTPDDLSTKKQIFEYDAQREELVRISVGQCEPPEATTCKASVRINDDGNSSLPGSGAKIPVATYIVNSAPTSAGSRLAVSADGSYVFFKTSLGLTPQALNNDNKQINVFGEEVVRAQNVYEYHSAVGGAGRISEGNVYLISDGRDVTLEKTGEGSGVDVYGTDSSGGDVFIRSGDPLVGQDTDTQTDVYDARVDGGFPAPPPPPPECEAEGTQACQGPLSVTPPFDAPGSTVLAMGGNLIGFKEAKSPPSIPPKQATLAATRARRLAGALTACAKDRSKKKRAACAAQVKKVYGVRSTGKKGKGGNR